MKLKIICALILFCFFQINPSISLELKIPKDLKKLGDVLKKGLDKKDKSKKTKKKEVSENKISNCNANNNYIYYSDVRNDKFYKRVWKFQAGGGYFEELTNFSFIVKSPDKDYEVEYIVNPKKKDNYGISGDFTAINLKDCKTKKYKFRSRENYIFMFDEANLRLEIRGGSGTWYSYYGTTCKNEQNPQCMKKLAEINLIGYRDLKNNFSYTESVDAYKNKIAEDKRLAEKSMEMMWEASESLGKSSWLFTGVLHNGYNPPDGFCFDSLCGDEPIMDDPK